MPFNSRLIYWRGREVVRSAKKFTATSLHRPHSVATMCCACRLTPDFSALVEPYFCSRKRERAHKRARARTRFLLELPHRSSHTLSGGALIVLVLLSLAQKVKVRKINLLSRGERERWERDSCSFAPQRPGPCYTRGMCHERRDPSFHFRFHCSLRLTERESCRCTAFFSSQIAKTRACCARGQCHGSRGWICMEEIISVSAFPYLLLAISRTHDVGERCYALKQENKTDCICRAVY